MSGTKYRPLEELVGVSCQHAGLREPGLRSHLHARVRAEAAGATLALLQGAVECLRLRRRTHLRRWSVALVTERVCEKRNAIGHVRPSVRFFSLCLLNN